MSFWCSVVMSDLYVKLVTDRIFHKFGRTMSDDRLLFPVLCVVSDWVLLGFEFLCTSNNQSDWRELCRSTSSVSMDFFMLNIKAWTIILTYSKWLKVAFWCCGSFIVHVFHRTEFLITASCDGHIKFWKRQDEGVEFVKHFKAHMGEIIVNFHMWKCVLLWII